MSRALIRIVVAAAALAIAALPGCKADVVTIEPRARLRLVRAADGAIEVELAGAADTPRAIQLELGVESDAGFLVEDAAPPIGLAVDTVRVRMHGTNRAILFAGDKRGAHLGRNGVVARFRVRATGGADARGRIRITSALVAATDGLAIPVDLGGALTVP